MPGMDKKNLALRLGTALVFAVFFFTLLYFGDRTASRAIFTVHAGRGPVHGDPRIHPHGPQAGAIGPPCMPEPWPAGCILLHFLLLGLDITDPLPLWLALVIGGAVIHFGALFFEQDLDKRPVQPGPHLDGRPLPGPGSRASS